jgi:L-galactose dehydrogenase
MEYRQLGRTGLRVSALGLGASPFGGVFGEVDEAGCRACLQRALQLGINFIDCSPYYGLTRAETMLGLALRGVPRDAYILATKVGRYGATAPDFDFSAGRVTLSVEESLQRLGIDYVDLIQCHDIEFGDPDQIVNETIPALRQVVQAGKARFVGITGLPLKVLTDVAVRTSVDTILSYCRYSLNDTALQGLIPWLQEQGIGIISAAPLAMGLLTQQGPQHWHPAPAALVEACRRAALHCRARGADIAQLALQFAVANPDIATTLVGSADAAEIERNCKSIDIKPDTALLAEVSEILTPVHNLSWPSGNAPAES